MQLVRSQMSQLLDEHPAEPKITLSVGNANFAPQKRENLKPTWACFENLFLSKLPFERRLYASTCVTQHQSESIRIKKIISINQYLFSNSCASFQNESWSECLPSKDLSTKVKLLQDCTFVPLSSNVQFDVDMRIVLIRGALRKYSLHNRVENDQQNVLPCD